MSRRPADEAHGLSPREGQVMARLDAGAKRADVAAELGLHPSYIGYCDERYGPRIVRQDRVREAAVRDADLHYRRALAASGGRFL